MRSYQYNTGRSTPTQPRLAGAIHSREQPMKHREDDPKDGESPASSGQPNAAKAAKFELPIDLDDIVAVAIFDSILRVKRRKLRSRSTARRPR